MDDALLFQNLKCTSDEVEGYISPKKIKELASLELLFYIHDAYLKIGEITGEEDRVGAAFAAQRDLSRLDVPDPQTFDYNNLVGMSLQQISDSKTNISNARKDLVESGMPFALREDCLLYEWIKLHEALPHRARN